MEPLYIFLVHGWCSHCGKQTAWRFLKKLKIELPYNPAIPLLRVHKKTKITNLKRHMYLQCSKQHYLQLQRYGSNLSVYQQVKKLLYIYTVEYCSAIKKIEILPFAATWMDLEGIMLNEISQTEKDKYCMISLICESKT